MPGEGARRGRRDLTTTLDVRAATVDVANGAERGLVLFSHGLEPAIYDQLDFVDAATRLVLAHRYARVRILLIDPSYLVQETHRVVELGRRLVGFVSIRRVHRDYRQREDGFLIADDHSALYLPVATQHCGEVGRLAWRRSGGR